MSASAFIHVPCHRFKGDYASCRALSLARRLVSGGAIQRPGKSIIRGRSGTPYSLLLIWSVAHKRGPVSVLAPFVCCRLNQCHRTRAAELGKFQQGPGPAARCSEPCRRSQSKSCSPRATSGRKAAVPAFQMFVHRRCRRGAASASSGPHWCCSRSCTPGLRAR
jgi:hypothetical protein